VENKLDEHDKRFDELDAKIDKIYQILDGHMKRIEDILQDNAARDIQQARMEKWIFQIADKLDLKLNYE
jgi:prefoldin subunit 5